MSSPWLIQTRVRGPQAAEQGARSAFGMEQRLAVFPMSGPLHLAAEDVAHDLHAVADAHDGDPEGEDLPVAARCTPLGARCPALPERTTPRTPRAANASAFVPGRQDLRVHLQLPKPTSDQLGVLRAEVHEWRWSLSP